MDEKAKGFYRGKKAKLTVVVGYNGFDFCGSQKQNGGDHEGQRTVEGDVEKALYEAKMIDPRNYGDIKKIRWSRASRTDKKVHALLNYFAMKLHYDTKKSFDDYKKELNQILPKDIHLFSIGIAGKHFDARCCVSYREYDYYLPTFMLNNW